MQFAQTQRIGTLVVTAISEKALLVDSEHCTYAEGKCYLPTSRIRRGIPISDFLMGSTSYITHGLT